MSELEDSRAAFLEAKIYKLETMQLEYEGLTKNIKMMTLIIKEELCAAKVELKLLGKEKGAAA